MSNAILDSQGRLILGPDGTAPSRAKVQITPDVDDLEGIGLHVKAGSPASNDRAGVQIGDFKLVQDSSKAGVKNVAIVNAAGTKVVEFVDGTSGLRKSYGDEVMYETAIPLVFAPSWTSGNNGAFTVMSTLPYAYPACFIWLPINSISATLPAVAGWYYAECSTTAAGTIYNNTWDGLSTPVAPTTKVAFATTGVGAFTGPTSEVAAIALPVAVADCVENGRIEVAFGFSATNNGNAKTIKTRFTNVSGTVMLTATATSLAEGDFTGSIRFFKKSAAVLRQRTDGYLVGATAALRSATAYQAEDVSAEWSLAICPAKGTATDALVIEWLRVTRRLG